MVAERLFRAAHNIQSIRALSAQSGTVGRCRYVWLNLPIEPRSSSSKMLIRTSQLFALFIDQK